MSESEEPQCLKALNSFFNSAPMMMGLVDIIDDEIIHIYDNSHSAHFFGHKQDFLKGKSAKELGIPQDIIDKWKHHYQKALKSKKPVHFSYWFESSQGSLHLSATVNFIEITSENHPRFSYIVQDTTENVKTFQELKKQEQFLDTVLNNIPDMIFVKHAKDLKYVRVNKAFEELVGVSNNDLEGKSDYDLFSPSQADFFISKDRRILEQGKIEEIPEEPFNSVKGERIAHTKKIPLYDKEGTPKYLVGIAEDITEKILSEKNKQQMYQEQLARIEAEKSLQAQDEFISLISHELKSPLSALILQAQMFRRNINLGQADAYSHQKIDHLIDQTEKNVKRLERLINDMLDASRMRMGMLAIERRECNLYELIKDVLIGMKEQFVEAGISEPTFIYSTKNLIGKWDSMRIGQVLVNLLTNAIRYGKGSSITIKLSQENNMARFSVQDQGPGIAPEDISKIFGRFSRAVNRNEGSGLGLGLFICKQIIEAHEGKIWVESKEGLGSSFYVDLPLEV